MSNLPNGAQEEGTGKRSAEVTEWAVSGLGWCGRREREREKVERERDKRGTESERVRNQHNYRLTASQDNFSKGNSVDWREEAGGERRL